MTLVNGIHHLTVLTADLDRLIAFYERVFESRVTLDLEEEGLRHAFIEVGPTTVLHPFQIPGIEVPTAGHPMFVRKERLVELDDEGFLPLAPDLAVEVVSPSNTVNEMSRKVQEYLGAGTSIVWIVEPLRRQVAVHTQEPVVRIYRDGDTLDGGDVFPGFTLSVTYIFDGPQTSR